MNDFDRMLEELTAAEEQDRLYREQRETEVNEAYLEGFDHGTGGWESQSKRLDEVKAEIERLRNFGKPTPPATTQAGPSFEEQRAALFAEGEKANRAGDKAKQKEIIQQIAELEHSRDDDIVVGGQIFHSDAERQAATETFKANQVAAWNDEGGRRFDEVLAEMTKKAGEVSAHTFGRPKAEQQIQNSKTAWNAVAKFEKSRDAFVNDFVSRRSTEHEGRMREIYGGEAPQNSEPQIPDQLLPYTKQQFEKIMRQDPQKGWEILNAGRVDFEKR